MSGEPEQTPYQRDLAKLLAVEEELDLFSWYDEDVPIWRLIRYTWFQALLRARSPERPKASQPVKLMGPAATLRDLVRRTNELVQRFTRSPIRGGACDLLVIGHARRVWDKGLWRDPYVDPLLPLLRQHFNVRAIEPRFSGAHRSPAETQDLRYLDGYERLLKQQRRSFERDALSAASLDLCNHVHDHLSAYDITNAPSLADAARHAAANWRAGRQVFSHLLSKTQPKALVLVNYIGCQPLLAAAHSCGIRTIELQHGSPGRDKLNYHFPQQTSGIGFPDYFFSFGSFWHDGVELPIADNNIRPIGFRFLNEKRTRSAPITNDVKNSTLVISQPIRECQQVLAELARAIAKKYGDAHSVFWRPHPSDAVAIGVDIISQLKADGVRIANSNAPLYDDILRCGTVIGAYSTALFEAVAFGRRPQLVRVRNDGSMDALVEIGGANHIQGLDDISFNVAPDEGVAEALFARPDDDFIMEQFQDAIEASR